MRTHSTPLTTIMVLLAVFSLGVSALAQQASINLEGVIRDEFTNQPVGCKIYIYTPSGKKISITSKASDGSYLQTLSEAGVHKISLVGHNIQRSESTIDIPQSSKFRIIKQDFLVKSLVEGKVLAQSRGFEKNTPTISADGRNALNTVAEMMRSNHEMNIVVRVTADEDQLGAIKAKAEAEYSKAMDAYKKSIKKLKKNVVPPPPPMRMPDPADPNIVLMQQRVAAVQEQLAEVKNGDLRIVVVADPLPMSAKMAPAPAPQAAAPATKPTKGKTKAAKQTSTTAAAPPVVNNHATLIVTIGKVKKLFD
jgi:hypothetical protein